MNMIGRFFNRVKLPKFSVSVYGKLPCHKEYLQAGVDPLFRELKTRLDKGFERRISEKKERPHVLPDRRFYISGGKGIDLVGCIFDSDDGIRAFPFIMAAGFPSKTLRRSFSVMWQSMERICTYMEAYTVDLRAQPDANAFYRRVRNVVHELDPFQPDDWSGVKPDMAPTPSDKDGLFSVLMPHKPGMFQPQHIQVQGVPNLVITPGGGWRNQITGDSFLWLGTHGMQQIGAELFRDAEAKPNRSEAPTLELPVIYDEETVSDIADDADEPVVFAPPAPLGPPAPLNDETPSPADESQAADETPAADETTAEDSALEDGLPEATEENALDSSDIQADDENP